MERTLQIVELLKGGVILGRMLHDSLYKIVYTRLHMRSSLVLNYLQRSLVILLCIIITSMLFPATLIAASRNTHNLHIKYLDNSKPLSNAVFSVYRVADITSNGYILLEKFAGSNIVLDSQLYNSDWRDIAESFSKYIDENEIFSDYTGETDSTGSLVFVDLVPGVYIIIGKPLIEDGIIYTPQVTCFIASEDSSDSDDLGNLGGSSSTIVVEPKFTKTPSKDPNPNPNPDPDKYPVHEPEPDIIPDFEPKLGDLIIRNIVVGDTTERTWNFSMEIESSLSGNYSGVYFENGVANFSLQSNSSIEISNLPANIDYSIIELNANIDNYETVSENAVGVLQPNEITIVTFTNTLKSSNDIPSPEKKPSTPTPNKKPPQTGDTAQLYLWLVLMITSAIGLLLLVFYRNKNKK